MTHAAEEYVVELGGARVILRGVLRLESPAAYDRVFEPIEQALVQATDTPFTVDVSQLIFMNSSGIRALGSLVLTARRGGLALVLVGRRSVPWQQKTISSLQGLYRDLTVRVD